MDDKSKQALLLRNVFMALGLVFILMGGVIALTDFVPVGDSQTRQILGGVFAFMGCMEFLLSAWLPAKILKSRNDKM